MIKPQTLWALFKGCDDSKWLGDICRALGRQEVELDFGQKQMVQTIMLDSGWLDENTEKLRDRWRKNKQNQRVDKCGNVHTCPQNEDMSSMSSNVHCPQMSTSLHTNIHTSVHTNNKKNLVVIEGGMGETTTTKLNFTRERLKKIVNPIKMGDVLKADEYEPFLDYIIAKGFCERESNQTVTPSYIKAIVRSWKADGWADKNRHKITRMELTEVVKKMNEKRDEPITEDQESKFWNYLVPDFTHKNGDMVTKYTVAKMITSWLDIEKKRDAQWEETEEESERKRKECEAAQERWNHMILTHEDEIDD